MEFCCATGILLHYQNFVVTKFHVTSRMLFLYWNTVALLKFCYSTLLESYHVTLLEFHYIIRILVQKCYYVTVTEFHYIIRILLGDWNFVMFISGISLR